MVDRDQLRRDAEYQVLLNREVAVVQREQSCRMNPSFCGCVVNEVAMIGSLAFVAGVSLGYGFLSLLRRSVGI